MRKYYSIVHRHHTIWNPISVEKLNELYPLLRLNIESRVLDIACGTGEMLVQLYEKFRIKGTGVDIVETSIAEAEKKRRHRAPKADINFSKWTARTTVPSRQKLLI